MLERKQYNVGEWSEIYTLFRLLDTGKLYAADENLNYIETASGCLFIPLLRILREEKTHASSIVKHYEFVSKTTSSSTVKVYLNGNMIYDDTSNAFARNADVLLDALQSGDKANKAVLLEEIFLFLESLYFEKVKQGTDKKADIVIQIQDIQNGTEPIVGFSIKSFIGSKPTLFNPSNATNFIYEVVGGDKEIDYIRNNLEEIQGAVHPNGNNKSIAVSEIISNIEKLGCSLIYSKADERFIDNLMMIDSQMPVILSEMLISYYSKKSKSSIVKILDYIIETNPLSLKKEKTKLLYTHNVKSLLCAIALGMVASTEWDGTDEASGGYIVVKRSGEVVAYHIYNRDKFKEYLLNNTKLDGPQRFDTPPPSKKKGYDYGYIYEDSGKLYIKLNLQIRFL